ncbi:MAG: LamG domain-containing protein [Microcystis sp. M_OC_Ca_00000000_S217Cul]|uniref:LamG domain-containing protein n=1 Tax=unclassified Microcystis TaxID=2643300 RepID=UPI00118EB963|nr:MULTISPECIES: LamG domain-containing protein [unclassified Microcystis]TRT80902.1 MAG: LamG domain-containing protein [Microcystis sp. M_OC_Ca_00000000_S217Cul]TRT84165.1 MAG: LamG domain-containing protein [Microcystis sp. M_OC_Ca_00000000_C217Col]
MYLLKDKLQHISTITHESKIVVFATDAEGKISYTVKQDGFEDSYLNTPADQRTGWENWKTLEFPDEADDQSVIEKEKAELTHQQNPSQYLLKSLYKTENITAVAPVQVIAALEHIYVFRQSKSNTLLVDRFVLDGMTNKLNRKLEVRFKRSKQKHTPTKNMKRGSSGLIDIDTLDFRDANGSFFYEPTTELSLVNNLHKGWFSVVLVPTIENDVYRWHIFAYNSQTQKVEVTTIRASEEGLFEVKDYTVFEESKDSLVPRKIPGVIKRTLDIKDVTVTDGLSATKYDLQQAQQTQSGEEQLLKTATRLMLAIPTDKGAAVFSFAIAGDGTLGEINKNPDSKIIRSRQREVLLPLNTLDEIKAIGDTTPPPQGIISGFAAGTDEEDIEDLVKISTDGGASKLANYDLVKISGTSDYQGLYRTIKVDQDTFDIDIPLDRGLGYWEREDQEEGGLIFDGMITAYQKTAEGKLRVTCANHGLENGDQVQITGTEDYKDSYPVRRIDDTHFVIERKWAIGEAVNVKLVSQKRRGIVFDGVDDYIQLAQPLPIFSSSFTISMWVKVPANSNRGVLLGDYQLPKSIDVNFEVSAEGKLRFFWGGEQSLVGAKDLRDNQWHFISFVRDRENKKISGYIDGVLDFEYSGAVSDKQAVIAHRIGRDSREGVINFEGQIADLRVWKTARTAEDIKNSMYLQLTGKEVGLVGYWRLGGISEGKVVDFSVNGNDGTVYGEPYVSAATLNRNLGGGTTAVKYSNSELFAVSERATYEESFEFKVNSANPVNLAYLDNADGKNIGTKIFTFSYWGKTSRSAEETKTISAVQNKFEDLGNGWYRASCNVTIPDEVSLLRSFEIAKVQGDWQSLEIRKHRIRLLSDSITEAKYTDGVTLATLVDDHATLAAKLKELELKEKQEIVLLKEKRELESKIAAYNAQAATRAEIQKLESKIAALTIEEQTLKSAYQNAVNSPFNYFCKIKAAGETSNCYGKGIYIYAQRNTDQICGYNAVQDQWEFIHKGGNVYLIKAAGETSNSYGKNIYIYAQRHTDRICGYTADQWEFIHKGGNVYTIKAAGETSNCYGKNIYIYAQRHTDRICGYIVPDQWELIKCASSNTNIDRAKKDWELKTQELQLAKNELQRLQKILIATPADKAAWDARLAQVIALITALQTELNTLNTDFLNAVKNTQAKPQTMPEVAKDSKGLVTQGALLGFVQSASRLNAIETCEGNVQLSYLDREGRMRQTNYDATADGKNIAFEQWIPDAQRACLNFSNSNSVVKVNQALYLTPDWSIEAWFVYPLPETAEWNTLIRGKDADHHILVRNRKQLGIYLTNDSLGQNFYDSGFNMELLTEGWHHLTAVGRGDTTLFYIDGKKVGDVKAKALKDAEENLNKNPNDAAAKKKVEDIKKASLKSNSHVYAIANNHLAINQSPDYSMMKFDGVNDCVSLPEINYDLSKGMSVEAWVWYDSFQSWSRIIDFGNGAANENILLCNEGSSNTLRFGIYRQSTEQLVAATGALETKKWIHLAATIDASGMATLYKNGERIQTGRVHLPNNLRRTINYIGRSNWSSDRFFHGQITDVRIWNTARTQAEIKANMSRRLSGKEANLVAYYPLNKLEGGKVLDLVANNHGTVVEANIVKDQTLSIAPFIRGEQFGKLAEVRVWGVALSDDEIAVNSTLLLSGNEPGLLAYYPMSEATGVEVRDHSGNGYNATVSGANWWGCTAPIGKIDNDNNTPPIGSDALVSAEYSSVTVESSTKTKVAIMRRFFAYPATNGVTLLPDKRIETLELKWIGNAQFAPTLLGYIEGPPPVPSENLTLSDDYNGATSVELTMSEDVEFSWNRSQDSGLGGSIEAFAGLDDEVEGGVVVSKRIAKFRAGYKANFDFSYQFQNESSITSSSSLSMTDKLELRGTPEESTKFPHLGTRFIPKNIGYALVVSALADVFVTRLARTGKMVGYQVQPVDGIPPDVNTITFLMNPAYTMNGSLDGMTGSIATSDRFFKHVPEMRSQYGSLYPASYYRLKEAYELKRQIEAEDKRRESYFSNFDVRLVDELSLDRNIDSGQGPSTIGLQREEDKPSTQMSDEEKKKAEEEKLQEEKAEAAAKTKQQETASQQKQAEIQSKIADQEKRVQATNSFAGWQKRMESLQIRAGKRNIVNTYVWDADGGLRTEQQSFANTVEHTIGGSFSMNASLGGEANVGVAGAMFELSALATVNLTQTMSKTEARSKGFELSVDLSGLEYKGITDYNDRPIMPGEKVDRYRFMSFYLEGSTNHFHDFFNYVVDPEWLRSNDEEAVALRQAQAGKPNKAWRVLHRVTYVERPALMGFGRDVRKLRAAAAVSDNQALLDKIAKLEEENQKLEKKLDTIISLLKGQK